MSRRIPDPAGLIAGIAFTGIGLAFLVGEVDLANRARWVWPIVLFSLGAGILAAVLRRPADEAVGAAVAAPVPDGRPAPEERSDAALWPDTEVPPAPEEPSGLAVWPDHGAQPDAEAETVAGELPGTSPEAGAADEGPNAEPEAPGPGLEGVEEARRRQAGGPPA